MTISEQDSQVHAGWAEEGRRIAPHLDDVSSALVLGDDPSAAAEVALGIGRLQARRRRVAIGDLVGELPSVERHVPEGTVHGLVDVLTFGVSLSRVALSIDPAHNLLVLPSGASPLDHDALLRADRWPRLTREFHDAGALLLAVAPADAASLSELASIVDGVVLVGDVAAPEGARVIARASHPAPVALAAGAPESAAMTGPVGTQRTARPVFPASMQHGGSHGARGTPARPRSVTVALAAAAVVLLALAGWGATRLIHSRNEPDATAPTMARNDSASPDSAPKPVPAAASSAPTASSSAGGEVSVANPADSASAVPYAVAILLADNATTANSRLEEESARQLPALTWTPLTADSGQRNLLVVTGAFGSDSQASAFLRGLRARRVLKRRQGHVVRTPYALLVQSGVSRDQIPVFVDGYRLKGLPVYALLQPDGRANVYAGAFETPEAARPLLTTFRASGETPRVVYRTGRPN